MTETTQQPADRPVPPVAVTKPVTRTHHGDTFTDDFEWMREKTSDEVLDHLKAENAYTEAVTADQEALRERIYGEIKAHTVETDQSVPVRRDGWWYFARTEEGRQYAVQCRVPAQDTGDRLADWTPPQIRPGVPLEGEQVLLDGNAEAEGKPFFALGGMHVSPDGNLLAYAVDHAGDERFTLRVRDLRTGQELEDVVEDIAYDVRFDRTGTRVFYTLWDASWRPYRVMVHTLGQDTAQDRMLFEEKDLGMWTGFEGVADRTQLLVGVGNSEVSETWVIDLPEDAETEVPAPRLLLPRTDAMLASVEPFDLGGRRHLLIVHNRDAEGKAAPNGMMSLVAEDEVADRSAWRTVLPHRAEVKVDGAMVTSTHVAVSARRDTTPRVLIGRLADLSTGSATAPAEAGGTAEENGEATGEAGARAVVGMEFSEPEFDEELYACHLTWASWESPFLRLAYTSWITPARVLDVEAATGQVHLRREVEVPGHDPADYVVEREWATSSEPGPDGEPVQIPLTVIRRKDLAQDGTNPCLVYGYGSYEMSMDPVLGVARLSLLDRGLVYVVAHVRGGGELGRGWYEDGKKLAKAHSFTDFVDATRHIVDSGWVDPARIACHGGSAGGLLMGAVVNLAPELYRACLAVVPFVDALTSILDPDLPLSALEWEEWGNPIEDQGVYAYMKAYTPYENVRTVDYPAIAAVTSLNDTRVLYVEPAKWVAQLRRTVTSDQATPLAEGGSPILLRTEMDGGHGGASGRYQGWKDTAWEYAFVLTALGATDRVD